ncbi:MAG: DUF58 domain-containing protein [Deltaproteobacteria bacterium]|nr:DUF58 domain-containing protein [Deltaproteobacteria bacterium]
MTTRLDAQALSRLGSMVLRARTVVEGVLTGIHRSPNRGASVEFSEHKEYAPGDELKHVDWRAFGRIDKYYVKQFEQETNLRATILLDVSRSMAYRGARSPVTKLELGTYLAASLAYLLVHQGDAVGLVTFADRALEYLPPRARPAHLHAILETLERVRAHDSRTDLAAVLGRVVDTAPRRGLVIVVSDLFDFEPDPRVLLRQLERAKHDVAVMHVVDEDEILLPFEGPTVFEGLEGGARLLVDPAELRRRYAAEMEAFIQRWRDACLEVDADYQLVPTDASLDRVLGELARRRIRGSMWAS